MGGAVHGIWVRSDAQSGRGGEKQMVWWGCRWLCPGGPALVHGGPARGAETGGGDGLSIWGSIWAGGTAAGDSDKGLASGT